MTKIITILKNIIGNNKPEIRKPKRRKNKTYPMNKEDSIGLFPITNN